VSLTTGRPVPSSDPPGLGPGTRLPDDRLTGFEHLRPLFARRHRLPPDHPAQPALRRDLVTGHLPLAHRLARRQRRRGENLEDLEQVAVVGLINAVDRFEVDRGLDFLVFAVPTISGELVRHCRDRVSTIRIPRRVRALRAELIRAVDELSQRNGTAPRVSEICSYLDADPDLVTEALEAAYRGECVSLDEPFPDGDDASPRFGSALAARDHDLDLVVELMSLGPLLEALPERERWILSLRFHGNLTQSQIAAEVGLSQMQVSRLLSQTLRSLRAGMDGSAPSAS
jgi:RNA polymerase sigma-B factor